MKAGSILLITGATGLVGSHVAEAALTAGLRVRALVREGSDAKFLESLGVEIIRGDMLDMEILQTALQDVVYVVHAAAKVGDSGSDAEYLRINVDSLRDFLVLCTYVKTLKKFIFVSSLGVYPAIDHAGTDESAAISLTGIDAYTRSKALAEREFVAYVKPRKFPGVALRPGFIYGPRDRSVLPRLIQRLKSPLFVFFGSGQQKLNHTYVKNFAHAVLLALDKDLPPGDVINITDEPLVTKREFVAAVAQGAGLRVPTRAIPLKVAVFLARGCDFLALVLGPGANLPISWAAYKFLGLNLEYSIQKAKTKLGYVPPYTFAAGMEESMAWWRSGIKDGSTRS